MSTCKHGVDSNKATCANCQNERRRKASLKTRKLIAGLTRIIAPAMGHSTAPGYICDCCGIHEAVVPSHEVMTSENTWARSLLCDGCWRDLSTSEILNFYRSVYEERPEGGDSWEDIERAIRYPFWWRSRSRVYLSIEECR